MEILIIKDYLALDMMIIWEIPNILSPFKYPLLYYMLCKMSVGW